MKHATFTLAAGLILTEVAISEDLPPGVLLLSRVKHHIKEELQHLPDISCLETVQRDYQPAKGKMRPLDTVRLEVLTNGHKELFASPGDRKFSEQHPITYAGSGMLATGLFGVYLNSILVTGNVSNKYTGEEQIGGRRLARFDYRLPLMWSGQTIHTEEGSGKVGLHEHQLCAGPSRRQSGGTVARVGGAPHGEVLWRDHAQPCHVHALP